MVDREDDGNPGYTRRLTGWLTDSGSPLQRMPSRAPPRGVGGSGVRAPTEVVQGDTSGLAEELRYLVVATLDGVCAGSTEWNFA